MATIQQQIEIAGHAEAVRQTWARFITWAHTGSGRLVCDEIACVDAVRSGLVDFVPAGDSRTTVIFRIEQPEVGPEATELRRQLGHDLVVFKDYVERGGLAARGPTQVEEIAAERESERRGDKPRHVRPSGESDSTFLHSHFPT
jgi:hypothetical protein